MEHLVEIYTDGACKGNPGPGGWGVVIKYRGVEKVLSGAVFDTTNNQMELMAAIQGLIALKRSAHVRLYTDSKYVQKGITEWLPDWKKKNWKNAQNKPVKNQALWQQLEKESLRHQIEWKWIKGHNNHVENEKADELARLAIVELIKNSSI